MDPQERRGETLDALRRLLRAAESRAPGHGLSKTCTGATSPPKIFCPVADTLPASRVVLLLTYRPGYEHRFGDRPYQTRIAPGALSTGDSAAMAEQMLAASGLPDAAAAR